LIMNDTSNAEHSGHWGYWHTSDEPVYYDSVDAHELDIQRMADERVNTRLATTDLPHREGK
jgi:hypothetical protein